MGKQDYGDTVKQATEQRIEALKQHFNLLPHPEGGYYCEQYRAETDVNSPVDGEPRCSLSHIYFLLTEGQVSRWHKVLHDEIWNVYEGAPLRILTLSEGQIEDDVIGSAANAENANSEASPRHFYKVIKGGDYQAAQSTGDYTFVGCSVAPGFEFRDFSYIEDEATQNMVKDKGADYFKFL